MVSNTLPRRANDHPIGRLLVVALAAIVDFLYWLNARPVAHKRYAVVAMLMLALASSSVTRTNDDTKAVTLPSTNVVPTPVASDDPVIYHTGTLAGRKAGDLYAAFLGYPVAKKPAVTLIPAELKIDWAAQLETLWERKGARRGVTLVARQAGEGLVAEYRDKDPGRISLESYQAVAGNQASAICAELDWQKLGRIYKLNDREVELTKRVSCQMGGRVLLAYTMAELLPSSDGGLNRDYFNFLLRHGGRRYVESLPALHDDITSFGPLQFTRYAVFDIGRTKEGASKVNQALPAGSELRIPGSVILMRENDHLRAGYLFAVSNLADGISKLNVRQVATFEKIAGPQGVVVAQYIATAHNKPAVARVALRHWLDSGGKGQYCIGCNSSSRGYAKKTLNNYNALSATRS